MSRYPTLLNSNTFIQLPVDRFNDEDITLETVHKLVALETTTLLSYLTLASVIKKLLLSLKGASLSLYEVLRLWEIRILALVYISGIKIEIPSDGGVFQIQSIKYIKNEVDILIPELYKNNKLRRQHDLTYNQKQRQIEQFPREVSNDFKFLLLRIKYGSSLVLVNEYYNHIWRSQDSTKQDLNKISYSIMAVLIARQEFLTLINLINSILIHIPEGPQTPDSTYHDNLILIKIIASLIRIEKDQLALSKDEIELELAKMTSFEPLVKLNKVLNMVPPIYNDETSVVINEENIYEDKNSKECFESLQRQVANLEITGRTMCALCAKFDIETGDEAINDNNDNGGVDQLITASLHEIKTKWSANVTKYYGLE